MAFGPAAQSEPPGGEQLGQGVEEHEDGGHDHDDDIVADAAKERQRLQGQDTLEDEPWSL